MQQNGNGFKKSDFAKTQYSEIPWKAFREVAKASTHGIKNYGAGNWKKCDDINNWLNAAMRHIVEHMTGKLWDNEGVKPTNLLHLTCATINLMFATEMILNEQSALGAIPQSVEEQKTAQEVQKETNVFTESLPLSESEMWYSPVYGKFDSPKAFIDYWITLNNVEK